MSEHTRSPNPKDTGDPDMKLSSSPDYLGEIALGKRPDGDLGTSRPGQSQVTPAHSAHGAEPKLPMVSRMGPEHIDTSSISKTRTLVSPCVNSSYQAPPPSADLDARGVELIRHLYGGPIEGYGGADAGETRQQEQPVTDEQMDGIFRRAYENILMHGLGKPALAATLHQNVSEALGLWTKRKVALLNILDNHIFFETQSVQDWNAARRRDGLPHDSNMLVPDQDSYFPLRWAALEAGIKVRNQRSIFELATQEDSESHAYKRLADASTAAAQPSPRLGLPRSSTLQPQQVIPNMFPRMPRTGPMIHAPIMHRPGPFMHDRARQPGSSAPMNHPRQPTLSIPALLPRLAPKPQKNIAPQEANGGNRAKRGSNTNGYDHLSLSPSANIPFPASDKQANVTAVELLTFLPRYFRQADIVDRFITNGGKASILTRIINEHREMKGGGVVSNNTIFIAMKNSMRSRGGVYEKWTVRTHPKPRGYNHNNLNIAGLRTKTGAQSTSRGTQNTERGADPIQFKFLGKHVKKFPSGFDALDLTRCVTYAMAHPDEDWEYPKDFEELVTRIGGPAAVHQEHYDIEAFRRWGRFRTRLRTVAGVDNGTHEDSDEGESDDEDSKVLGFPNGEQARGSGSKSAGGDQAGDGAARQEAQSLGCSMAAHAQASGLTHSLEDSVVEDELTELSPEEYRQNLHIKRTREAREDKGFDQEE
ncbi:hypothetical protein PMIN06_000118 [Paraphaeosphaeria minitans]|uniref:Uncharacterized protein n=1 Tax=Paraphaeosphaeria minitans TaxID=565426 RepID=A0A9P6G515_9PLEO|nr:hypothetical protein PMIN01_12906 [Paraphaeosphaeria minitans]